MFPGDKLYVRYYGATLFIVLKSVFGAMFMLALSWGVSAQTCCSGGVPLGGSLGLGSAESKSLQVLVTYDYNAIHDLVSFSEELNDDTRNRTTQSSIIELNYGLSKRLSVATVFPFIRQTRTIQAFSGEDFTAAQGLGDMVFLLKYSLLSDEKFPLFDWIIGAGPKLPSGRTNYQNNQGLTMAADMQPGSGSLDGIFWSYFMRSRFLENPNLGLLGVTTFRYSGENKN